MTSFYSFSIHCLFCSWLFQMELETMGISDLRIYCITIYHYILTLPVTVLDEFFFVSLNSTQLKFPSIVEKSSNDNISNSANFITFFSRFYHDKLKSYFKNFSPLQLFHLELKTGKITTAESGCSV